MVGRASSPGVFGSIVTAIIAAWCFVGTASAACGDKDRVQCRDQFENVNAVVWNGDGFTAAGQLRQGQSLKPALLHLTRTGEVRRLVPLPWPANREPTGKIVADPRKLIALPKGGFILLGQLQLEDGTASLAWAMRVADNGDVVWNNAISGGSDTTVVHSGYYDPSTDKLIVVGRLTQGSDDGQCEKWSQSLVVTLNASDGQVAVPNFTRGEQGKTPTNRQAIFDIVPGEKPGSYVVAGVATIATSRAPRRCLDNMFVGTLTAAGNSWTLNTLGRLGAKDANEVAYAVRPAGTGGFYLLAGYRKDVPGDAPAAQAYRVRLSPFGIPGTLTQPFPPDGSDKKGGDRYRLVLPLEKDRFLLAGSASMSEKGQYQAIWQIVSGDLTKNDPPVMVTVNGSDIFDTAVSPDGRILAVGRWTDEDGHRVGFTGFIGERPIVFDHRKPDNRLADLSSLFFSDGAYRIPAAALRGVGYYGKQLAAGAQVNLAFSVSATRTIKISAHSESGDLDLIVSDSSKRPVAFSNFRDSATELLIATLAPGDYTLSIVANTLVPSYEVRLGDYHDVSTKVLAELQRLTEGQRLQLADALAAAGYATSPEPGIALGAETVRSLLAAQEGAGERRSVGPNGIGSAIAKMLATP